MSDIPDTEHFVAREEELARIHSIFCKDSGRRTAVIHGLGGVGKTQLAVAYAKRHRDEYSAVFWLNARDESLLKQGFARIAERILRQHPLVLHVKNAVESHDLDAVVRAVKQWLDDPKNNRWLIIYDGYDNVVLGGNKRKENVSSDGGDPMLESYDIRPFLTDAYHGAVLITTRSSRVAIGHRIPLRPLKNIEDSLRILSHTSNREDLGKGK